MHVVTFYSFKGGTGRSMALANVAADLLARNRRVLIVDFDLEAPGLDTFPIKLEKPSTQGLVEMIHDYLGSESESTPLATDYLYSARIEGIENGSLWLMPAGRQDMSYETRFRAIDWQDFYQNQGGFLFFEDLKAQWRQELNPDYVLIDSRTGHTDIGGICTRQLPDSVVVMFIPNEQNLRGLVPIVEDIRSEGGGPLRKNIHLHFVMGNVPDLDDEDEILAKADAASKSTLMYEGLAATIHHFNSLSLLEQKLMIVDRPRSKIALEYGTLTSAIVRSNLEDRDGALALLDQALADLRAGSEQNVDGSLEDKLEKIRSLHPTDVEVLGGLAKFRRAQRRNEEALNLYDQLLQLDARDYDSLVGRAEIFTVMGKTDAALKDLLIFFELPRVSPSSFAVATRLLMTNDRNQTVIVLESPALSSLPSRLVLDLVRDFLRSYGGAEVGSAFLRRWLADNRSMEAHGAVSVDLNICLIAAGRYEDAVKEIVRGRQINTLDLTDSFNLAMAEWGLREEPSVSLFENVVSKIPADIDPDNLNRLQCFSIAYWVVGDHILANEFHSRAMSKVAAGPRSVFSAWSYLYRSPNDFKADLDAMHTMYSSGVGRPAYIRDTDDLFPAHPLSQ